MICSGQNITLKVPQSGADETPDFFFLAENVEVKTPGCGRSSPSDNLV